MHAPGGIVLFAHGSRDPGWRAPIEAVRAEIERCQPGLQVRCAYLELSEPDLPQAVKHLLDAGVRSLRIVPMFLGTGRHAREDLPRLVDALKREHPMLAITLAQPVGEDPRLTALLAQIACEEQGASGLDDASGREPVLAELSHNDRIL